MKICMNCPHHHSDSIMHQRGGGIQTGGVFAHIQRGPERDQVKLSNYCLLHQRNDSTPSFMFKTHTSKWSRGVSVITI